MSVAIFNAKKLATLLQDLHLLSGMGVSFWHPEQDVCIAMTENVPSPYCRMLQSVPRMLAECRCCERAALAAARSDQQPHNFRCHAGLQECVSPVVYDGRLLGHIMLGMSLSPDANLMEIHAIKPWIESNGLDFDQTKALYLELPRVSQQKKEAMTRMIKVIARFVHIEGVVRHVEIPLLRRIDEYVDEYISEKIMLDDMAEALNVSKSTICHVLRTERNTTLSQIVTQKRIQMVKASLECGQTVVEAAQAAGFASVGYCSRVFLAETGMRPGAYQRMVAQCKDDEMATTYLYPTPRDAGVHA